MKKTYERNTRILDALVKNGYYESKEEAISEAITLLNAEILSAYEESAESDVDQVEDMLIDIQEMIDQMKTIEMRMRVIAENLKREV